MAKDLNKVMFTGRLGADPELRYTPQGAAVVNFRVASNRTFSDGGERQENTEWFRVVAWEALAERCNRWLAKGDRVYVEGRLQTRKWDKGGQTQYTVEVVASDIIFLEVRRPGHSADEAPPPPDYEAPAAPEQPRPAARPAVNHSPGARAARERQEQQSPYMPGEDLPL